MMKNGNFGAAVASGASTDGGASDDDNKQKNFGDNDLETEICGASVCFGAGAQGASVT